MGGSDTSKNGLGTWALVLGIASIVCCSILFGVIAIVLGNQSKKAGAEGLATNSNLGNIGFILGIIGSVLSLVLILFWFLGAVTVPFLPESSY
jgi:hypothetical protein